MHAGVFGSNTVSDSETFYSRTSPLFVYEQDDTCQVISVDCGGGRSGFAFQMNRLPNEIDVLLVRPRRYEHGVTAGRSKALTVLLDEQPGNAYREFANEIRKQVLLSELPSMLRTAALLETAWALVCGVADSG